MEFFEVLFDETLKKSKEWDDLIVKKVKNWDISRVALMDRIILKMALTEMMQFHSIPVKVTINEFINMWVDAEYKLMEKKKACEEDIADAMMRKGKLRKIIAEYEDEETAFPTSSL